MITDALISADNVKHIREIAEQMDLKEYEKLNDNILMEIYFSNDEELKSSKEIVERIVNRKLYKYVGTALLTNQNPREIQKSVKFLLFFFFYF